MKKAHTCRNRVSFAWMKSRAHVLSAWFARKVLQSCPPYFVRTPFMYFYCTGCRGMDVAFQPIHQLLRMRHMTRTFAERWCPDERTQKHYKETGPYYCSLW